MKFVGSMVKVTAKMAAAEPKIASTKRPRITPERIAETEIAEMKTAQSADKIRLENLRRFQPESTSAIEAIEGYIEQREKILRGG